MPSRLPSGMETGIICERVAGVNESLRWPVAHHWSYGDEPAFPNPSGKKVGPVVKTESSVRTIAFLGNYLPRKCGIATFTSDLLGAVAARHPQSRCFAVPVNDIEGAISIRTSFASRLRSRISVLTGAPPSS